MSPPVRRALLVASLLMATGCGLSRPILYPRRLRAQEPATSRYPVRVDPAGRPTATRPNSSGRNTAVVPKPRAGG